MKDLRELAEIVHKADKTEITMVVVTLLAEILDQLKAIREATENDTQDQDSDPCAGEPDMFATLNGPRSQEFRGWGSIGGKWVDPEIKED